MAFITIEKPKPKPRQNRPLEDYHAERETKSGKLGELKMGKISFGLKGILLYVLIGVGILTVVGAASYFQANQSCKALNIAVSGNTAFLDSMAVAEILTLEAGSPLVGEKIASIDLEYLEAKLGANPYVERAEVYKSLQGVLFADVQLRTPMARLVNYDGTSMYIDTSGVKFPGSLGNSANVMLVRGNFDEKVLPQDQYDCETIAYSLPVLKYIYDNEFWNAQISEVFIGEDGQLALYPQVGNITAEFGYPQRIEEKFENWKLFYHQVVKEVGWKKYKAVKLMYKGQVVGVKN